MKNFIDFTMESANNSELSSEFLNVLKSEKPQKMEQWFKAKSYNISNDECKKLIENKYSILKMNSMVFTIMGY